METDATLEQVQEHEQRIEEMTGRIRWLKGRLAELTDGLGKLHAQARGDAPEARTLREERGVLRDELEELEAAVPVLTEKVKNDRGAAFRAEAERRLTGITRAHGSGRAQMGKDVERAREAAEAYAQAVGVLNDRYDRLVALEIEAGALAERFGVTAPDLPNVLPPERREGAQDARRKVKRATLAPNPPLSTRKQGPPADSPGAKLLAAAGPSEAERKAKADAERRERERKARDARDLAPVADKIDALEGLGSAVKPGAH